MRLVHREQHPEYENPQLLAMMWRQRCEEGLRFAVSFQPLVALNKAQVSKGSESALLESEHISRILGSFTGLEIIPCKWLVAELILAVCAKGMSACKKEKNKMLITDLQRTQFFKNGVLVVAGSQLIYWIRINLSLSSSLQLATGSAQTLGMLQKWEEWFLNLIDKNIEAPDYELANVLFPQEDNQEAVLEKIGSEPENWFLFLVLGLIEISPRLNSIINQIVDKVPKQPVKKPARKGLTQKKVLKEKGSLKR